MPVQSRTPVPAAAEDALGELAAHAASLHAASGGNLLACLAAVPDPRDPRGRRHSLASILAISAAAALCGCTTLEDVTAWVSAADQQVLAAAGCRRNALGARIPPHPDTIVRVFTLISAQDLADHAGAFLARRAAAGPVTFPVAGPGWLPAIAVDGKAVRGAAGPDGAIPYLLAAAAHDTAAVIAEKPSAGLAPRIAPTEIKQDAASPGHPVPLEVVLKFGGLTHTSVSEQDHAGHAVAVRKLDRLMVEETPRGPSGSSRNPEVSDGSASAGTHQRTHGYLGPDATRHTLPPNR